MDDRLQYVEEFQIPHQGHSMIHFEDGSKTHIYVEDEVSIGVGTAMDPNIQVGTPEYPLKRFIVGDHGRLFAGQILAREFICGDYVTIHEGVWCYGRKSAIIGHNSWFGMRCTLDAEGGFKVGNGFGAGQDTHLWSHIRHGDTVQGSRFLSFRPFEAENDVWFVGRCTSSPAHHGAWSVALTESNIVKDMLPNHVYGGNPAEDLTEKIGAPYDQLEISEKEERFQKKVVEFAGRLDREWQEEFETVASTFDVEKRTYMKRNTILESMFMRFLLPEAKFVPEDQPEVTS